jgi:hypothetical protein
MPAPITGAAMPAKPISKQDLAEIYRHLHNQGISKIHMKGFTDEIEESREIQKTFEDIAAMGYGYIHTLIVEPSDGRPPYYVHVDSLNRKQRKAPR